MDRRRQSSGGGRGGGGRPRRSGWCAGSRASERGQRWERGTGGEKGGFGEELDSGVIALEAGLGEGDSGREVGCSDGGLEARGAEGGAAVEAGDRLWEGRCETVGR